MVGAPRTVNGSSPQPSPNAPLQPRTSQQSQETTHGPTRESNGHQVTQSSSTGLYNRTHDDLANRNPHARAVAQAAADSNGGNRSSNQLPMAHSNGNAPAGTDVGEIATTPAEQSAASTASVAGKTIKLNGHAYSPRTLTRLLQGNRDRARTVAKRFKELTKPGQQHAEYAPLFSHDRDTDDSLTDRFTDKMDSDPGFREAVLDALVADDSARKDLESGLKKQTDTVLKRLSPEQIGRVIKAGSAKEAGGSVSLVQRFLDWFRERCGISTSSELARTLFTAIHDAGDIDACRKVLDHLKPSARHELQVTYREDSGGGWSYTITAGEYELFDSANAGSPLSDEKREAVKALAVETHINLVRNENDLDAIDYLREWLDFPELSRLENAALTTRVATVICRSLAGADSVGPEVLSKVEGQLEQALTGKNTMSEKFRAIFEVMSDAVQKKYKDNASQEAQTLRDAILKVLPGNVENNCNMAFIVSECVLLLADMRTAAGEEKLCKQTAKDTNRGTYYIAGEKFSFSDLTQTSRNFDELKSHIGNKLQCTPDQSKVIRCVLNQTLGNMTTSASVKMFGGPLDEFSSLYLKNLNDPTAGIIYSAEQDGPNIKISYRCEREWNEEAIRDIGRPDGRMKSPNMSISLLITPDGSINISHVDAFSGAR